jgi:hypothetical protein
VLVKKSNKAVIFVLSLLLIVAVLTGCERKVLYMGSNYDKNINGSFKLFTGTEGRKVKLQTGELISIKYSSKVTSGELSIKLFDPERTLVKEFEANESGEVEVQAEKDGQYKLEISGVDAGGSFDVKYEVK